MTVPGTKLHCAVSASGGPTTIVCGDGTQSPRPGSYSFAVANTALLVLKASQSSTPLQVKRDAEPSGSGGTYPGPATAGGTLPRARRNGRDGRRHSHLLCGRAPAGQGRTSRAARPTARRSFFVKSYVGAVSEQDLFVIRKLDQKRTKTVFEHKQP